MDRKQMCIANVQYKQPSADGARQSKNLLRYLTYRESRDEKARYVAGRERWVDCGMGGSVSDIIQRCDDLKSDHVLAFSLVVNPNPDLIALVAPEERERFVGELTEGVVDEFFEARGLDTGVEFSYVLHHRLTDDPQAPGLHDPHTHVVLPGTVYDEEHGGRVPLFFSRNRKVNHIELLHDVTERAISTQMERYVGPDWEQRIDALLAVREREQGIVNGEPHGWIHDDAGEVWPVWCGTRRTDDTTAAIGTYCWYPAPTEDDEDALKLEFRPLLAGLPPEQAAFFAHAFAREMAGDMDKLRDLADLVGGLTDTEREQLIAEMGGYEQPEPGIAPDLDL
ncbi:MAG: hypothetical protein H6672_13240 [Anaerolineaceae bacterium]|nr:hypothetical protein [Anaerolineaceae bacterium]